LTEWAEPSFGVALAGLEVGVADPRNEDASHLLHGNVFYQK